MMIVNFCLKYYQFSIWNWSGIGDWTLEWSEAEGLTNSCLEVHKTFNF